MKSDITRLAAIYLKPLLLILAVIVLFRGHHHPGGGFIAALLAATAIVFEAVVLDSDYAFKKLHLRPKNIVIAGMLCVFIAAIAGFINNDPMLTGLWTKVKLPIVGELALGTPLLFDIGVFLIVTGSLVHVILYLLEEIEWK